MGLNVGVSLWVAPPDAHAPVPRDNPPKGQTFAQRAGVEPQAARAEQALTTTNESSARTADLLGTQRLLQTSVGAPERGVLSLYGLGLRAGNHLSYVPSAFAATTLAERWTPAADNALALYQTAGRMQIQTLLPSVDGNNAPERTALRVASDELAEGDPELPGSAQVSAYLMRKWPERHLQVLPRGKGIEVIIRDYHLGQEEQQALVQDLTRQALCPQSIWINGQPVWQAPSLSRHSTGDAHGH